MNLTDLKTLRAFLERHGLNARKGLGQHFLCSQSAVDSILGCLHGIKGVLEIGPGPGVLTTFLGEIFERVIALEIDPDMASALLDSAPTVEVRRIDALKSDLGAVLNGLPAPRAVVSNLPYYITAPLVAKIAEARDNFDKAVLMMQREVASRFLASPGDSERGSISVYLQAHFSIRKVADVSATAFWPPPKVDSTILEFVPNGQSYPEALFEFVRQGFAQPRKTVSNSLMRYGKTQVGAALVRMKLDPRVRPHQLTFHQWQELHEAIPGKSQ